MGSFQDLRARVAREVERHLGPNAHQSGSVLYSGWRTLCPGQLYVMGLNPGGSPEHTPCTVLESLDDPKLENPSYSAYKEKWNSPVAGSRPHQLRVMELVRCLDQNVEDVFAANAIFVRSTGQNTLRNAVDLWTRCWPLHQLFLSMVRPRIILCLGNGETLSAFSLLRRTLYDAPVARAGHARADVKSFPTTIDLGDRDALSHCLVIGVRHPSRFAVSAGAREFLATALRSLST